MLPSLSGGHHLVAHEITAERTAGGAGRRIFRDAESRRKHPTVHRRLVACRLGRKKEDRHLVEAGGAPELVAGRRAERRAVHGACSGMIGARRDNCFLLVTVNR